MYKQTTLWDNLDILGKEERLEGEHLKMKDAEITLYRQIFSRKESNQFLSDINTKTPWRQDSIKIFGKTILLPRLTAWYGDQGKSYTYSGIPMNPEPWTDELIYIKSAIEEYTDVKFNSVLLNLYRDGNDSVAWHSDDEDELGENPVIASLSLGSERKFMFKHKYSKELKAEIALTHGSVLIMKGPTQRFWHHQLPKTTKKVSLRINLTFRVIK